MKIAVTGGNGLLGDHVVAALEPDHEVTVLDKTDAGERQALGPVDLMDLELVARALSGCDALVHLGGFDAAVDASPAQFYQTNTMAAWNVMHAGYEAGARLFSLCSSSSVYGFSKEGQRYAPDSVPIDETHRLRANDAYGLSKRVLEEIGRAFAEREGMSVTILRPCYIAYDHLMPRLMRCKRNEPEPQSGEWAEPLPALRWLVAPEDVANCFRLSLEASPRLATFNVSGEDTFSPIPTRERIAAVFGETVPETDPGRFERNPFASPLDCAKAATALGWKPTLDWAALCARAENQ